uniref:Uncharacterized protein n=1 Tax=Cyprinus carpio carpio TaxID=630221 RepID=A0A9J7XHC4_CYPCA
EVVTSLHKVKDKKTPTAESQEPQKPAKKKKRRANVTQAKCDDKAQEEQPVIITEHEEEPALLINFRKQVDPNQLNELKEFCPKIESKSSHEISKMIMYDLPRFKEFRKQGIMLRHGRFSNAENERLRQNVRVSIALIGVKDATKLFHPKHFPKERQELTKMKKVYKFFEKIGNPRPCHDVFMVPFLKRFTEVIIKSLPKYHSLHGSNWQKISELTGRSSYSLEKLNTGKSDSASCFSTEQRHLRAVRDHIVTVLKSESPNKTTPKRVSREIPKIALVQYSLKFKTRCWSKCIEKWISILAVQMSSGTCWRRKAQEAKIRLIKAMYQLQVEDIMDVNWDDLTAQAKWHHLKVCYVPDWKTKCFGDIVDFLYERVLPGLMKDCEDLDDSELKVDQNQSFLLSDIFRDINEDHCSDHYEKSGQKEDDKST